MSTIRFDKFISIGRKLDEGIRELEELWHLPRVFVGGYADLTEQTEEHIKMLKKSIQCTQVKIIVYIKNILSIK